MSLSRCRLDSLPDEILVGILSLCSVIDVLRVESTSKLLHAKCQDRLLWVRLLRSLDVREAPNLPPGERISDLSASDLRRKTVGAIGAAHNWCTEGCLKITRRVELQVGLPEDGDPDKGVKPRLLPGGREVLMENYGRLELWSLLSKERLWVSPEYKDRDCITFDFQLSDDGKAVNIADVFVDGGNGTILRVYNYNFDERTSTFAFEQTLPDIFLLCAMLRGSLLMSCIPLASQVVIMNWKTGQGIYVDFADRQTSQGYITHTVELIDRHLVSFKRGSQFSALAVPVSTLNGHWTESRDPDEWQTVTVNADDWPVITSGSEYTREMTDPPLIFAVHYFKPTWIRNSPTEIYVATLDRKGYKPTHLVSYRLQLSTPPEPESLLTSETSHKLIKPSTNFHKKSPLSLVSSSRAPMSRLPWNPDSLSNAGRMFTITVRDKVLCFSLFPKDPSNPEPLPVNALALDTDIGTTDEDVVATVEPWSGATVVGTPGRVRVFYLQN